MIDTEKGTLTNCAKIVGWLGVKPVLRDCFEQTKNKDFDLPAISWNLGKQVTLEKIKQ